MHDCPVAEPHVRRLLLEDARQVDRHLRVTWHPEGHQFVFSTWRGDVCSGAVRMTRQEAARIVAVVAGCLAEETGAP